MVDGGEREKKARGGGGGRQVPFGLGMDGLPSTNAGRGRAPEEGARGNVPLPSTRERKQAEAGEEATAGNEATAGEKKAARTEMSTPQKTQTAPVETDPRIALGEHGWVAGMPWPKGKVTFAQRRRWRPGMSRRRE